MITTEIKHFKDLTLDEFHDLIALRIEVFIIEQNCPYQELDGLDKGAYHLLIRENDKIIATARILLPGIVYPEIAIGRVVSSPRYRSFKLGHLIMKNSIEFILNNLKENKARLSAQSHLVGYYEKHGFQSTGKNYLEDGIPHTEMLNDNLSNTL